MLFKHISSPVWSQDRGKNLLDGGAPFYDTYKTKDGKYMAMYNVQSSNSDCRGPLEPHFYAAMLNGLELDPEKIPDRNDPSQWEELRQLFTRTFANRTQKEWEDIFVGTDACVTPVVPLTSNDNRPIANLSTAPSLNTRITAVHVLTAGDGAETALTEWLHWTKHKDYIVDNKGVIRCAAKGKL